MDINPNIAIIASKVNTAIKTEINRPVGKRGGGGRGGRRTGERGEKEAGEEEDEEEEKEDRNLQYSAYKDILQIQVYRKVECYKLEKHIP